MSDPHASTTDPEIAGVFRKPFTEQVAFFRRKLGNLVPTERWDDMQGAAHDDGFMVAGAVKADLLNDLAAATDKAIAEGMGLEAFRADFRAIVAKNGWTGWTGEGSVRGEAWRVKTIYRTNMMTSYAAGRMAQLRSENWPLWLYRHGGSREPRLHHLSWNGIALPPDHPFWTTHYPPSDWGCSCYVLGARSARGVKRLGGDPDKQLPANWQRIDRRTGAPIGIGKGWNYAPGASVSPIVQAMAAKVSNWDYRIGKGFMESLPQASRDALAESYRALPSTADDARRAAQRTWEDRPQPPGGRTLGMLRADQIAAIGTERGVAADGFDFSLAPDELAHVRREHGNEATERAQGQRAVTPDDFALLPGILSSGSLPRFVGTSRGHNHAVYEITRTIDGEQHVTRWEYWRKRRTFTLLNYFIRTGERT